MKAVCAVSVEREMDQIGSVDARRVAPHLTGSSVVLDIGCGMGRLEKYLYSQCHEIYAVDVSGRMLAQAKKRLGDIPNVHFRRLNAKNLRLFPDEMFDLCFSFHCLQHMAKEDAYVALKEILRVLKPCGLAYLHFPDFTADTYFSIFKQQIHRADESRVRAYTATEIDKIVTDIGFKVVGREHACLNPFVLPIEPNRDILITLSKGSQSAQQ